MKVPDELRARVVQDLEPVRPHLSPWKRALLLLPAAVLVFAAAPALLGMRSDADTVGPLLSWGASIVQLAVAVALIAAALREAVPGDAISASAARLLLGAGAAFTIVLGVVTHMVSPEHGGRVESFADWFFCWRGEIVAGLPLLVAILVLIARGLAFRPALAGALAGLAAGASVDAGWRLYCNYSNPSHVIPSHAGGVLALTAIGVVAAVTLAAGRQSRR